MNDDPLPKKFSLLDEAQKYGFKLRKHEGIPCTIGGMAMHVELQLTLKLKERVIVDVEDLWEKQKKYGTIIDKVWCPPEEVNMIASKYGIKYKTESGESKTYFPVFYKID